METDDKTPKSDTSPGTGLNSRYNRFCVALGVLGILLFALSFYVHSGIYYGHIQGNFDLEQRDYSFYSVRLDSETPRKFYWAEPRNFSYDVINLNIYDFGGEPNDFFYARALINFQSLTCTHNDRTDPFSKELLIDLFKPDAETRSRQIFLLQVDELYNLLISLGNGSGPKPRHHMHHFDGNLEGTLVHFDLGGPVLPLIGILLSVSAIPLWLVRQLQLHRRMPPEERPGLPTLISPLSIIILSNFGLFMIAFFLTSSGWLSAVGGETLNNVGAGICLFTTIVAVSLICFSPIYIYLRYSKGGRIDVLVLSLSVLICMVFLIVFRFTNLNP